MHCKVELKKQVLPVLRSPLYLGSARRLVGVEDEALDESEERAAERARLSGLDLEPSAPLREDGEAVYG